MDTTIRLFLFVSNSEKLNKNFIWLLATRECRQGAPGATCRPLHAQGHKSCLGLGKSAAASPAMSVGYQGTRQKVLKHMWVA
jgi:hypothetical protein